MNDADREWAQSNISEYEDFESFVVNWLNKDNIWKYYHFYPQHYFFLELHKKVRVDYFAFLENLDNDIEHIAQKVNPGYNLHKKNKTQHKDYKDYYTNRTIEIVSSVYSDDINLLGYSFDNSSLEKQIYARDLPNAFPYISEYSKG